MRISRTLALGASMLVLVSACATGGGGTPTPTTGPTSTPTAPPTVPGTEPAPTDGGARPPITIGSAGFYESALMAEIYAQVLEASGFEVTCQLEIGPRT